MVEFLEVGGFHVFKPFIVAGAAWATLFASSVHAAEKPSLAVYGQLPNIEQIELSPDGSKLAVVLTNGE